MEIAQFALNFSPIMLALCLMLFSTYYAQNYAGIIGSGLDWVSANVCVVYKKVVNNVWAFTILLCTYQLLAPWGRGWEFDLSQKSGLGKNGPAGPILDEKVVRLDHSWLTKNHLAGPILVTKSGPPWPKMVQCHELSTDVSTMCIVIFSSFLLTCSCFTQMN